jgi:hypothetical protein
MVTIKQKKEEGIPRAVSLSRLWERECNVQVEGGWPLLAVTGRTVEMGVND